MKIPPWIGPKTCTPSSVVPATCLRYMPNRRPAHESASATATTLNSVIWVRRGMTAIVEA